MHCAKKCGLFLLIVFIAAAIGTVAGLSHVADWLSAGDRPQNADAILVLGGDYSRPF